MGGGRRLCWPARPAVEVMVGINVIRWIVWGAATLTMLAFWATPDDALAVNFVVNVTADLPDLAPGNASCDVSAAPGDQCTLRAAIQEANALGGGPHAITLPPGPYTL